MKLVIVCENSADCKECNKYEIWSNGWLFLYKAPKDGYTPPLDPSLIIAVYKKWESMEVLDD